MIDKGAVLQAACEDVLTDPALRPIYDKSGKLLKTFCNMGARRVAQRCGCSELDDLKLTAEDMIALIRANKSGRWKIVDGRTATLHALDGGLALAFMDKARLREAHAHIAAVCPESMQKSGSLGRDVPMLANVGRGDPAAPLEDLPNGQRTKRNAKCKASAAFPVSRGECEYAIWS